MNKTLGILGGMGPLATADLYRKIVELTEASSDNGHIRTVIDSNAHIPDRTGAILSGGPSPLPEMKSALANLKKCGVDCIIMPCNTAHYFLPELQKETVIPFISILSATAASCRKLFPGKTAAILATKGTLSSGLYQEALENESVPYLVPEGKERDALMYLIYDVVKASGPISPEEETWRKLLDGLKARGADYFILGCTELPILADTLSYAGPYIDPTAELAKAAIRFCGYRVKGE